MTQLGLRLRILLFFALIGLGGTGAVLGAIWAGHARAVATTLTDGFVMAAILSALALLALSAGVWLLFDENIAKPIEKLAAEMRVRAHAGTDTELDTHSARYLGDLAHAAAAISGKITGGAMETAQQVALATERLALDSARLTALLTEIPVAMILVNPRGQIVLYDGQAAEVLSQLHVPRLNAPLSEYFEAAGPCPRRARDAPHRPRGPLCRAWRRWRAKLRCAAAAHAGRRLHDGDRGGRNSHVAGGRTPAGL